MPQELIGENKWLLEVDLGLELIVKNRTSHLIMGGVIINSDQFKLNWIDKE